VKQVVKMLCNVPRNFTLLPPEVAKNSTSDTVFYCHKQIVASEYVTHTVNLNMITCSAIRYIYIYIYMCIKFSPSTKYVHKSFISTDNIR
jgi:hypothetical protein